MTKLRSRRLAGAVMVAVLMAGSLRGVGTGADNAVVWEARSAVAESGVAGGQGWVGFWGCAGCIAGGLVTSVASGGAAAIVLMGCGVLCSLAFAEEL